MDLQLFTQVVISSLLTGVAYGSVGLAFVTVYRVTSVINFPQADLGLVGAFVAISLSNMSHLASIAGAILASAVASALIYLSILYPLRRASLLVQTIALLGGGIALQSVLQMVYGTGPQTLAPLTAGTPILINGAAFPLQGFWVLGWGVVLVVGLYAFFERTLLGRAVRACAIDRYAAGLVGIPIGLMAFVAFVLGGIIAGVAITVQAPLSYLTVESGLPFALKGFIAAIIGGAERIVACMIAGIMLGVLEGLVILWIPGAYQQILVLLGLLAVLMLRPGGLGRKMAHGI